MVMLVFRVVVAEFRVSGRRTTALVIHSLGKMFRNSFRTSILRAALVKG